MRSGKKDESMNIYDRDSMTLPHELQSYNVLYELFLTQNFIAVKNIISENL